MRVLITDGNERSALAVTRALGQNQVQVLVGAEEVRSLAGMSRYSWQSFSYPSPYSDPTGFVFLLLDTVKRLQIGAVFPISDIAMYLVSQNRHEFEKYTGVPIPSFETFECLSDKYRLMKLASELGVPTPKTFFVPNGCPEQFIEKIDHFPVVIKPARSLVNIDGSWRKTGVHYAASAADLYQLYHELAYLRQPSLIQHRVTGQGQGLFALMNHGKAVALFAHKRLREKPPSGGVSVLRESIALPHPMTEYALRLLEHVGWHGVAMVEFKVERESGLPFLMEVNGRFWGSLQLATDCGLNFPLLLHQVAAGGGKSLSANEYRIGLKSRWLLGDVDHLLMRLLRPKIGVYLPKNSPSRLRTLLDFLHLFQKRTRFEVLRMDDLKPFIYELRQYFINLLVSFRMIRIVMRKLARSIRASISDPNLVMVKFYLHIIFLANLQERLIYRKLPRNIRNVLFVCKGNICRSPLAAEYVKERFREKGFHIVVRSAGIETTAGGKADPLAMDIARKHGLSLYSHVTTPVIREIVDEADIILVMEIVHSHRLRKLYPDAKYKMFQLGYFSGTKFTVIEDPYQGNHEKFRVCFQLIRQSCDNLLQLIDTAE